MRQFPFGFALTAFSLVPFAASSSVPYKEYVHTQRNIERAQAVKDAFEFAWSGYMEYAFPQDELRPVSKTPSNSRFVDYLYIVSRSP